MLRNCLRFLFLPYWSQMKKLINTIVKILFISVLLTSSSTHPYIDSDINHINDKKTLMQSIKYAAKIIFIWALFYWRSFEKQQAHGLHLFTWVNSHKSILAF